MALIKAIITALLIFVTGPATAAQDCWYSDTPQTQEKALKMDVWALNGGVLTYTLENQTGNDVSVQSGVVKFQSELGGTLGGFPFNIQGLKPNGMVKFKENWPNLSVEDKIALTQLTPRIVVCVD